jgi:hypothetical protein
MESRRGRVARPLGADSTMTSGESSSWGTSVGASPASCSAANWPSSASFSDLPTHSPCRSSNYWPLRSAQHSGGAITGIARLFFISLIRRNRQCGASATPRHAEQSNRTAKPHTSAQLRLSGGPDQIRTGDLVLDRDACLAATPRDRTSRPLLIVPTHVMPRQRIAPRPATPPQALPGVSPGSGHPGSSRGSRACYRSSAASLR